ncbi:MAG: tetratricopeptide repeat protein [Pseudomonadota bacterium]
MRKRLRGLCCQLLAGVLGSVPGWSVAAPEVVIDAPQYRFTPGRELQLDRDAKLAPEEFELSQTLRPLLAQGDYRAAYTAIEGYREPRSAALELLAAQLLGINGDYPRAIVAYQAALEQMPQLTRAHAGLGTLYLMTDNLKAARDSLAQAVVYGAADVQTFAQLGYLNQQLALPWSAITAYQQALMLEPDNGQWQRGLLNALMASGNFASAGALIDELLERTPEDVVLWQQRANLAMKERDNIRALASLETALRLGDKNAANRLAAAQLHLEEGNYTRAGALLQTSVERGALDAQELYPLVIWMVNRSAYAQARSLITAANTRAPQAGARERSLLAEMRGRLALAQTRKQDAAKALTDAVNADASNGRALLALARLRLDLGQLSRAAVLFERAEVLPDQAKQALLGRAQIEIERGNFGSALRLVRRTQERFPGSYELDAFVQSLSNLSAVQSSRR